MGPPVTLGRLKSVRLKRFKAAFKPEPIQLRPFNIIIGRNGSGKSTLLEALQWLDTTLRHDARRASERYYGVRDLVNLRSRAAVPSFELQLGWEGHQGANWDYSVKIEDENGVARVGREELTRRKGNGHIASTIVATTENGNRIIGDSSVGKRVEVRDTDRLALGRVGETEVDADGYAPAPLRLFWERAVFLRLSPNRLAFGSPATRKSYEPILDEEGQNLPALLNELDNDQREALIESVQEILPGIKELEVSEASGGRDSIVHYSLFETMPYRGRNGRTKFPIPAWMLSEGTRRITAILALLQRTPPPSLLCIEEVENGLDPWTVRLILEHLQEASRRGTQVVLTTHSPWLLDHVPIDTVIQVRRSQGDTVYEQFATRDEIMAYDPNVPAGTRYVNEAE